jgi:tetratricopeptide (TPR) repeat protein
MTERHIPQELFERFLRSDASQEEVRQVVRHLLGGCPQCEEMSHRLSTRSGFFGPGAQVERARREAAYEEVFDRAFAFASQEEHRFAVERLRGWAQWAALEPLSPQERLARVESDPQYHTFGLYDRLLEAGRWSSRTAPAEAVEVVRLAVLVAERLEPATLGERRVADLRAVAWAALGNVRRIAADFEGASQAFDEARHLLKDGTGDPAEEVSLLSLEASYLKDIGEFERAESSLEGALRLCQKAGDVQAQGRILVQMGEIIGHVHPDRGIAHIRRALALLDSSREPRLELCAQHALAWFLNDRGQPEEALAVLEHARPLYEELQDEPIQLRLHWLEGRIAFRMGQLSEAEIIFGQIRDRFRAHRFQQEVVLVTIDLAQVLSAKGETARAAELAGQCTSILWSWGLPKDTLAAWLVFQRALAQGSVVGDLFERVAGYYRRHWFRPAKLELGG